MTVLEVTNYSFFKKNYSDIDQHSYSYYIVLVYCCLLIVFFLQIFNPCFLSYLDPFISIWSGFVEKVLILLFNESQDQILTNSFTIKSDDEDQLITKTFESHQELMTFLLQQKILFYIKKFFF